MIKPKKNPNNYLPTLPNGMKFHIPVVHTEQKPNEKYVLLDKEIRHLQYHLNHKTKPAEGFLFHEAFMKCRLDYSLDSIRLLDKLFSQISQKGLTVDALLSKQGSKNFFLTVAIYLVNYIGKQVDQSAVWTNHDTLCEDLSKEFPKVFAYSLGATFDELITLPIEAIEKNIKQQQTFEAYIQDTS